MKRFFYIFFFSIMACVIMQSCSEEDTPSAFDGEEPVVNEGKLPTGNSVADQTIREWYQKYGFIALTDFEEADYSWNVTSTNKPVYNPSTDKTGNGYNVIPAANEYVEDQLQLISQQVFRFMPDSMIRVIFPKKLLLASEIWYVPGHYGKPEDIAPEAVDAFTGYDFFAFSGANQNTRNLSQEQKHSYRVNVLQAIFKYAISNNLMDGGEFASVSNYAGGFDFTGYKDKGFLDYMDYNFPSNDLTHYLTLVMTTPYEKIEEEWLSQYPMVKKKYELLIKHFKTAYDIDLQSISDTK